MSEVDTCGPDSIERVLQNRNTGELAVGIRLRFMDKYPSEALASLQGYKMFLEPHDCDAWAIDDQAGHWLVVPKEHLAGIEDLGPL